MGVLTEIVIANKEEANTIALAKNPLNEWPGIDAKGHNDLTLASLFSVLQGRDYDVEDLIEFPLLAQESEDGGPWVFEVPKEVIEALSQIQDIQLPEIIRKWLETGELGDATFPEMENSLLELRALAKQSLLQEKDVLMWICL